jgi:hypothetical protein
LGTTIHEYCDTPIGLGNQQRESSGVSLWSTYETLAHGVKRRAARHMALFISGPTLAFVSLRWLAWDFLFVPITLAAYVAGRHSYYLVPLSSARGTGNAERGFAALLGA